VEKGKEKTIDIVVSVVLLVLFAFGLIYVFYQSILRPSLTVSKPSLRVLINDEFNVPAGYSIAYNFLIPKNAKLYISFEVISGGDINFYVMDEVDYWKFKAGESFYYYEYPSRFSIRKANIDWNYPPEGRIYFVWLNLFPTTQTVRAYIAMEE